MEKMSFLNSYETLALAFFSLCDISIVIRIYTAMLITSVCLWIFF